MVGLERRKRVLRGPRLAREGPILLVGDAAVATLNEAAARREHPSDRELYRVTGRDEEETRLHESLAEGALPKDERPIVILERAGERFGSAGAVAIDQHDQGQRTKMTVMLGDVLVTRVLLASLGSKHESTLGQELRGDFHRHVHNAPGIVAKIEDQAPGPLSLQRPDGIPQLVPGRRTEPAEPHIARDAVGHSGQRHRGWSQRLTSERQR